MPDRVADLLARYRALGLQPPPWAYPLPPSIPFIGRHYGRWGGVLVYGSAENLSHYRRRPETVPMFLCDDRALDRHRAAYELDRGEFFPEAHLAINDGSLLVAVWYYLWRTGVEPPSTPRELLEAISAANFGKFSIEGTANCDYVSDRDKLSVSRPYVLTDLKTLQPAVVILPRGIWDHGAIQTPLLKQAPTTLFLPLPQFNRRVVNIHLADHEPQIQTVEQSVRDTVLPSWIAQLKGYRGSRAYRFLVEMDQVMGAVNSPSSSPQESPH